MHLPLTLVIKRRQLPHWHLPGATYFVTFRLRRGVLSEEEQRLVVEHIKRGDGRFYDCFAATVMPDHAHLLFRCREGYGLSDVMKGIKGVSAYELNRLRGTRGRLWQGESYDHIVRSHRAFENIMNYIFMNPVRAGLTDDPSAYVGWYDGMNEAIKHRKTDVIRSSV